MVEISLPPGIVTRHPVLRPFVPADADALTAVFAPSRAHLQRSAGDAPATPEQVLAYIRARRSEAEEGSRFTYGVFRDGKPIGAVQLDLGRRALGYWIAAA